MLLVGCGNQEADIALIDAARIGSIKDAKKTIAEGANVNAKDKGIRSVMTPFHYAARWGRK